jgi:uncharacterized damage-inducible protein DinB
VRDSIKFGHDFRCSLLGQKWDRIEREKAAILKALSGWRDEELTWRPSLEEWSAAQVLDHVVRTEEAIYSQGLSILAQKPSYPSLQARLRFALLEIAFRFPVRVKVPRAVAFLKPANDVPVDNVFRRWELQRAHWSEFLRMQDCAAAKCTAMRHPVVGDLSVTNTVTFMLSHMLHHRHQLGRIRRRLGQTLNPSANFRPRL